MKKISNHHIFGPCILMEFSRKVFFDQGGKRQKKPPADFASSVGYLEVKSSAPLAFLNELLDNSNPILEVISGLTASASNTKAKSWDFMGGNAWSAPCTLFRNTMQNLTLLSS